MRVVRERGGHETTGGEGFFLFYRVPISFNERRRASVILYVPPLFNPSVSASSRVSRSSCGADDTGLSRGEEIVISELINNKLREAHAGQFSPSKGGKGSRINGWAVCNEFLHSGRFKVFANCEHFIRTVPELQRDENNPEDVDTEMEDHVADEWRYSLVSRGHRFIKEPPSVSKQPYMSFDYICEMEDEGARKKSKYSLYEKAY